MAEARGQQAEHLRHEQQREREQDELREQQQCEDPVGEQPRRGLAATAMDMGIGRNEGGVEGALGKDRAKTVGQPPGHIERIRHRSGAEDRREHDVAHQTGQPGQKRVAANGENPTQHVPLLPQEGRA